MNRDYAIIAFQWVIMIVLLLVSIPKNKIRQAMVAFLFKQLITWVTGLTVAELGLIEYPVRLFPHASGTSFTFEYFAYPAFCAIFNVHYPENKGKLGQLMYYFVFCSALTAVEVIFEKNTNILKYVHWTWYTTWITLFLTFYITRKFYVWFFKLKERNEQ